MAMVEVLMSEVKTSTKPKEDGSFSSWVSVQGVMHLDDGRMEVMVDSIFAERGKDGKPIPPVALKPGKYTLQPRLSLDFKTRQPMVRGFDYIPVKA